MSGAMSLVSCPIPSAPPTRCWDRLDGLRLSSVSAFLGMPV